MKFKFKPWKNKPLLPIFLICCVLIERGSLELLTAKSNTVTLSGSNLDKPVQDNQLMKDLGNPDQNPLITKRSPSVEITNNANLIDNDKKRELYIVRRKKRRKIPIPKGISKKDGKSLKKMEKNRKLRKVLKVFIKRKEEKYKLPKKDKFKKHKFSLGDFNNMYNTTNHLFPEKLVKTNYNAIASQLEKVSHNYDIKGATSREDNFYRKWGVQKHKIGDKKKAFLSTEVGKKSFLYLNGLKKRKFLKNENIPSKNLLSELERAVIKRKKRIAKLKLALKKKNKKKKRKRRRKRRNPPRKKTKNRKNILSKKDPPMKRPCSGWLVHMWREDFMMMPIC